jgi:hypothetical protein
VAADITVEEGTSGNGAMVKIRRGGFVVIDLTRWEAIRLLGLLEELAKRRGWR